MNFSKLKSVSWIAKLQDGAEPASNSVAAWNLLRLASFLDKPELRERAAKVFEAFSERLAKIPMALPEMASAFLFNPTQIIITGVYLCTG